jgi:armadillo repeat-containing protein 7
MFSSKERLQKRTPENGIGRGDYIQLLVDEFYESNNSEANEQVTANLANFAYDPLNYEYLKNAKAVDLFLELLDSPSNRLTLHGIAGICNLCTGA